MQLQITLALGALALVAATSCRTTNTSSSAKGDDSANTPVEAPVEAPAEVAATGAVLTLSGASAKTVYDATSLEENSTDSGTVKAIGGRLSVWCTHNGLPPGAQGIMGPSNFDCSATVPLPDGAEGFPAPPFLSVAGTAAMDFYGAFQAPESFAGGVYQKIFTSANATFDCHTDGSGYGCTLATGSTSGGIPPGALGTR